MEKAAPITIIRKDRKHTAISVDPPPKRTIFQRLNAKDEHAVADFIHEYGHDVWAFSMLHTRSIEEAELLSHEIFKDIWAFADRNGNNVTSSEHLIINNIAIRTLIKHKWHAMMRF